MRKLLKNMLLVGIVKQLEHFRYISNRNSWLHLTVIQTKTVCVGGYLECSDTYLFLERQAFSFETGLSTIPRRQLKMSVTFDILGYTDLALIINGVLPCSLLFR